MLSNAVKYCKNLNFYLVLSCKQILHFGKMPSMRSLRVDVANSGYPTVKNCPYRFNLKNRINQALCQSAIGPFGTFHPPYPQEATPINSVSDGRGSGQGNIPISLFIYSKTIGFHLLYRSFRYRKTPYRATGTPEVRSLLLSSEHDGRSQSCASAF